MTNDSEASRLAGSRGPTRRTVLQASAVATGALALPATARAARSRPGNGTKVTVVLFQRGGADHLNVYAPTGDPNYANLRPTIGLSPPGSASGVVGLAMDATFSMHPAMAAVHARYTAPGSDAAVVQAVGYQPYNRSHFESQDLWETSLGGPTSEGWINRHLQVTATAQDAPVRGLALRSALPRSMFGPYPCYAVASTADLAFAGAVDNRLFLEAIATGTDTSGMVPAQQLAYQSQRDAFALIDLFAGLDPASYAPANGAAYPESVLGAGLAQIAEVIKAGLGVEFFTIDNGGWDHHSNLVTRIAQNAADLGNSIAAFFTDLGALAQDVVLVTMSEFGRTAAENGSGGTDHGAGGAMLVVGGAVNGGQVHGVWPTVAQAALENGQFVAPANDYRDVLREVLDQHMGGTDPAVVFPGRVYQPIGVL